MSSSYLPILGVPSLPSVTVPEPKVVHHYTSLETMMKIVDSRQMWATGIEYLNDTAERELFLRRVSERMTSMVPLGSSTDAIRCFGEIEHDAAPDIGSLPSVVSFSADDDSLPQWRAYTPPGAGVCIGFDVDALKRAAVYAEEKKEVSSWLLWRPTITFGRVEYLDAFSAAQVDRAIEESYSEALSAYQEALIAEEELSPDERTSLRLSEYFKFELSKRATFYKDRSFQSEEEYRIVVSPIYWQWSMLKFRFNNRTVVPYVPITIPNATDTVAAYKYSPDAWSAIKAVRIGPATNMELTARAVRAFFRSKGMQAIVNTSDLSFRDW